VPTPRDAETSAGSAPETQSSSARNMRGNFDMPRFTGRRARTAVSRIATGRRSRRQSRDNATARMLQQRQGRRKKPNLYRTHSGCSRTTDEPADPVEPCGPLLSRQTGCRAVKVGLLGAPAPRTRTVLGQNQSSLTIKEVGGGVYHMLSYSFEISCSILDNKSSL
jgi:hypothetical protein